jgi:hypothetical protein
MDITNSLAWNIIGRDAENDKESIEEERKRFLDLHYDRFTYYPFHERPRYERDYTIREV